MTIAIASGVFVSIGYYFSNSKILESEGPDACAHCVGPYSSVPDSLCVRSMALGYQLAIGVMTIAIMREVELFTGENIS